MDSFVRETPAAWNLDLLIAKFEDMKGDMAGLVLPSLHPAPGYKVAKKAVRPTMQEAKMAFIDLQTVVTNMPGFLMEALKTRPEPFVLMQGDNTAYSQVFCAIHGEALEHRTQLGAGDACFKVFYVFDVQYPKQCCPV